MICRSCVMLSRASASTTCPDLFPIRDERSLMTRRLLADIAPIGFVHFNRGAAAAEFASRLDVHCFADAVGHEPSSLVSHAQHAL